MKDEYSSIVTNNLDQGNETTPYIEVDSFSEVQQVDEFYSYENQTETSKKSSKADSSLMSRISAFFITIVAAVTIVVPATTSSKLTIKFSDAIVTDTTISYEVLIDGDTDLDLYVLVSNDFTKRKMPITGNLTEQTVENLKPNMKYKISVMSDGTLSDSVLAEMEVKTLSIEDYRLSRFNGCKTECRCHIDGYFYFTMDFVDNIGSFTDFEATLTDTNNNVSNCEFNYDLHAEQKISVKEAGLTGNSGTLLITCLVTNIDGTVASRELYRAEVAI